MHDDKHNSSESVQALTHAEHLRKTTHPFGDMDPAADNQSPGPTRKMPKKKETPNDEAEIKMQVTAYKGKVILNLGAPAGSIVMTVKQARYLANALWNQAHRTSLEEKAFREQERKEKAAGRRRH